MFLKSNFGIKQFIILSFLIVIILALAIFIVPLFLIGYVGFGIYGKFNKNKYQPTSENIKNYYQQVKNKVIEKSRQNNVDKVEDVDFKVKNPK